ncbi:MAG: 4-hydroxy-tetrahydrodipicolinate reductase [Deltaproteobacteria bacterium]|nr:MAG: 4-hydroxy-tetrahydrodipicolinate reductase [Deltaproteobacteria bacterium]
MPRVVVCGAMGKMGRAIIAALRDRPAGLTLSGAVEVPGHPLLGQDASEAAGAGKSDVAVTDDFSRAIATADVAIDFSRAESSVAHAAQAAASGKPIVIGSTGFTPEQLSKVGEAARGVPCVLSPNMSVGVNLMFKVAADVARVLGEDYDVEIVEVHHRFKKDSPSGTAVKLADVVAGALGREMKDVGIYGRRGMTGERPRKEIGVLAVRAGDVVGEHTLVFGGIGERFEITHRAHSRETFARGAVRAAAWVLGKPNGLYDMRAVLEG